MFNINQLTQIALIGYLTLCITSVQGVTGAPVGTLRTAKVKKPVTPESSDQTQKPKNSIPPKAGQPEAGQKPTQTSSKGTTTAPKKSAAGDMPPLTAVMPQSSGQTTPVPTQSDSKPLHTQVIEHLTKFFVKTKS